MKSIIFIVGMHRCGTSFLTSAFVNKGYCLGKSKNTDQNWQNPKGYFENDKFTEFHNKLLMYNNCKWNSVEIKDYIYTQYHVNEYIKLIEEEFHNENYIIIKDPRLTFFEPFLFEVCNNNFNYKIIFATRNYDECCRSLSKAQNITLKQAQKIYNVTHTYISEKMIRIDYKDSINNNLPFENIDTSVVYDEKLYREKHVK